MITLPEDVFFLRFRDAVADGESGKEMESLGLRDAKEKVVVGRVGTGQGLRVPGDDGPVHVRAHRGAVRRRLHLHNTPRKVIYDGGVVLIVNVFNRIVCVLLCGASKTGNPLKGLSFKIDFKNVDEN
jgi:hypothetical protein